MFKNVEIILSSYIAVQKVGNIFYFLFLRWKTINSYIEMQNLGNYFISYTTMQKVGNLYLCRLMIRRGEKSYVL